MIEIFESKIMFNAIIAGLLTSWLLGIVGVFVVLRKQAMFADGIAHASLLGVAIGLIFSGFPMLWAVVIAIIAALLITYINLKTQSSLDAVIGVIYSLFFAIAIVILSFSKAYRPEISSYLIGSILLVTKWQILLILAVVIFAVIFFYKNYSNITYVTFDPDAAKIRGINTNYYSYILNTLIAVAAVIGVNLMGVVLVTSLVILGPLFSQLMAKNFKQMFFISVIFNTLTVLTGLVISYYLNTPSGATVVIVGSFTYLGAVFLSRLR